jgi:DNA-binding CsgD family transcriptional regulator
MYEFFWTTNKTRLIVHDLNRDEFYPLTEDERILINKIHKRIEESYPDTYQELLKEYDSPNKSHTRFLIVNRFLKCNFSLHDNTPDIDDDWNFTFERVPCPLRGECKLGYCKPKLSTSLSDREIEVIALHAEGFTQLQTADKLYISERTVHNHITNIYKKLGFTGKSNPDKLLINYAYKNNLIG